MSNEPLPVPRYEILVRVNGEFRFADFEQPDGQKFQGFKQLEPARQFFEDCAKDEKVEQVILFERKIIATKSGPAKKRPTLRRVDE